MFLFRAFTKRAFAFLWSGQIISRPEDSLYTIALAWTNALQEFVPAHLRGRVISIDVLVSEDLTPIGYALAGLTADRIGAAPVFLPDGAIAAGVIALGLLNPTI